MTVTTTSSRFSMYVPQAIILLGLILVLLAALAVSGFGSLPASSESDVFDSFKITGQLQLAPPPYCPHGPGTHGKGSPPANTAPGKGNPGARQRPCG